MFCLNLMRIALELAKENRSTRAWRPSSSSTTSTSAAAMKHMGGRDYQLWDERGRLLLRRAALPRRQLPQVPRPLAGRPDPALRGRAAGGATGSSRSPSSARTCDWFLKNRQDLVAERRATPSSATASAMHVLTIVDEDQLRRLLARVLGPGRVPLATTASAACRRHHEAHPFGLRRPRGAATSRPRRCRRSRAATRTGAGRSGSRPAFLHDRVAAQAGQGLRPDLHASPRRRRRRRRCTLWRHGASDLADRLIAHLHARRDGPAARLRRLRASSRTTRTGATCILFYEYFHGDNGAGLGASHQTGWTALVASLIDEWRRPPQRSSR